MGKDSTVLIDLVRQTSEKILEHNMLKLGDGIIVGVSGGPDSMALLAVFFQLREKLGIELEAAHIHHGLREEADLDLALVEKWCSKNNIRFNKLRVDLKKISKESGLSLEEAGRNVRRSFFEQCSKKLTMRLSPQSTVKIALAHHMQDQAETLIINLSRGSGLAGLAGMKFFEPPYIRPFLSLNRDQIIEWLDYEKVPWRTDHTNEEVVYTRNRIRHMLLPVWEKTIGYNPVKLIARAAFNLAEDQDYLNQQSQKLFVIAFNKENKSLDCTTLYCQHSALQIRVLGLFFEYVCQTRRDLGQKHFSLMQSLLMNQGGPYDLPGGWSVIRKDDCLYLERKRPAYEQQKAELSSLDWELSLNVPGIIELPDNLGYIEAVIIEYQPDFRYNSQMNCFDKSQLEDCSVRLRKSGDIIRPVNRKGTRTLKKYMNEEHIPANQRNYIPVIAKGNDIVWLADYVCGHQYVCRADKAQKGVRIRWIKDNLSVEKKTGDL